MSATTEQAAAQTPQQQFAEWWAAYRDDKDPSIMPARSVAAAAFDAGRLAVTVDVIKIEERVRTERNDLADHLRRVLAGTPDDAEAARAYLLQIGAL